MGNTHERYPAIPLERHQRRGTIRPRGCRVKVAAVTDRSADADLSRRALPRYRIVTGRTYKGRIDSLGLDENGCLLAPGDDVQEKHLKLYVAFRRLKNFACVIPCRDKLLAVLKLDPVALEEGWGTRGCWPMGNIRC